MKGGLPNFISAMADDQTNPMMRIAKEVWESKEQFIRWPKRQFLYWPGIVRHRDGRKKDCYQFSQTQRMELTKAGLEIDGRNNGPAILSFKLAGGERPVRQDFPKYGWSIHHIYDGKFPVLAHKKVMHAVRNPHYFTEAAGLVALHPIADSLAAELPYFSWLLRYEAFIRFKFDPDHVFGSSSV